MIWCSIRGSKHTNSWHGPEHHFFKVRADADNLYILRHLSSGLLQSALQRTVSDSHRAIIDLVEQSFALFDQLFRLFVANRLVIEGCLEDCPHLARQRVALGAPSLNLVLQLRISGVAGGDTGERKSGNLQTREAEVSEGSIDLLIDASKA